MRRGWESGRRIPETDTKALLRMKNGERAAPKGLGTRKRQHRYSGDDYNLQLHTHRDDVGLARGGGGGGGKQEKREGDRWLS